MTRRSEHDGPGALAKLTVISLLILWYSDDVTADLLLSTSVRVGFYHKYLYEGDKAVLSCERRLKEQPGVAYWRKDGHILQTDGRIHYDRRYSRSILFVDPVVKNDRGVYQCVTRPLQNGTQLLSSPTRVDVKDLVSVAWKEGHSMSVRERSKIAIHCQTNNSDVMLKVLRNGRNILEKHGRIQLLIHTERLDLVLLNVQASDAGLYTCSGSDDVRVVNATISLEVCIAPTINNVSLTGTFTRTTSPSVLNTMSSEGIDGTRDTGWQSARVYVFPTRKDAYNRTVNRSRILATLIGAPIGSVFLLIVFVGVLCYCCVLRRLSLIHI